MIHRVLALHVRFHGGERDAPEVLDRAGGILGGPVALGPALARLYETVLRLQDRDAKVDRVPQEGQVVDLEGRL